MVIGCGEFLGWHERSGPGGTGSFMVVTRSRSIKGIAVIHRCFSSTDEGKR